MPLYYWTKTTYHDNDGTLTVETIYDPQACGPDTPKNTSVTRKMTPQELKKRQEDLARWEANRLEREAELRAWDEFRARPFAAEAEELWDIIDQELLDIPNSSYLTKSDCACAERIRKHLEEKLLRD